VKPRRHPAAVTADRLRADYERYYDRLAGSEMHAIGIARTALQRIVDEDTGRLDKDEDGFR
jgi:hypothetical protein